MKAESMGECYMAKDWLYPTHSETAINVQPKERIAAIINGQACDRVAVTPIFMAWAAHFIGRSYRDYYLDMNVLVEAQLAVVRAFGIDQISVISDPWREASAYGMEFDYPQEGVGKPKSLLIEKPDQIARIKPLDIAASQRMIQRVESVAALSAKIGQTHSVLGWVEGPLAEYADLRGVEHAMFDLIDKPEMYHQAAEIITQNAIDFAVAQIRAGADMIGIGDAAASLIGRQLYENHVLELEKRLIDAIHEEGGLAKLHICGDINSIIEAMATTGADVIDVDWKVPLDEAREKVGQAVTLCGNFNPSGVLLQGTPQEVADAAKDCIKKGGKRFILMPGCEVPQHTPEENIRAFCPA
jgi:MtaA/CmuA family methyltransferase